MASGIVILLRRLMGVEASVVLVTNVAKEGSRSWQVALALAEKGAQLVLHDAEDARLLKARADQLHGLGCRTLAIMADLTVETQVKAMLEKLLSSLGQLNTLVVEALSLPRQTVLVSQADLQALHQAVRGTITTCRVVARHMLQQACGGSILLVPASSSNLRDARQANRIFAASLQLELGDFGIEVKYLEALEPSALPAELSHPPNLAKPETGQVQVEALPAALTNSI
jgi:NAD(P)-dependent dehydrogenase (short-subunit alcohol dehydrogenase family)